VSEYDREASIMRRPGPVRAAAPWEKTRTVSQSLSIKHIGRLIVQKRKYQLPTNVTMFNAVVLYTVQTYRVDVVV
jgi:hypothetical protein